MKKLRIPGFFLLGFMLAISASGQTGKPLKLDPGSTAATMLANGIANAGLFMNVPPMIDPAIDEGSTIFSYFAKPTYHIGLPGQHLATEITPEGRLFNGSAELVFYTGNLRPMDQRIYTLLDGWLPCVQYTVAEDGVDYKVDAFQYWLEGEYSGPPVNFARVTAANTGKERQKASLALGYKFGGKDHRSQEMVTERFNRLWSYSFASNYALRSGKLVYYFDQAPGRKWQVEGVPYRSGRFFILDRWTVGSIVQYDFELAPGESRSFTFKLPQKPTEPDEQFLSKLAAADFESYLEMMKGFWTAEINQGMTISLAEPKVQNASRAALVHNIMCQEYPKPGEIRQTVNRFQYNKFWLRDGSFFAKMYALWGRMDDSQKLLRYFLNYQDQSGNFISQPGQLDGFGQSLHAFGEYIRLSGDQAFAKEILNPVKRGIAWFEGATAKDKYGLMPPTSAMDNEFIIGRYTGHNFWALAGIDGAIAVTEAAGDNGAAGEFSKFRASFAENLRVRVAEAAKRNHGVIPPGMDVPGGVDWGNLFEVYPSDFIPPDDPLVKATFAHYRKTHYREGVATYRRSMHHYVTERVAEMSVRQGNQEEALSDLYSMLVHTGSCHQGFEWTLFPGANRDYCPGVFGLGNCNYPPHGWYAALYNILLRNMLIREEGDTLHLLSVTSPEWVKPGDQITVSRAPTYFGNVSFKAEAQLESFKLSLSPEFRKTPQKIVLHFPFFAQVSRVTADGREVSFDPGQVLLPAGVSQVLVNWRLHPEPGYSYRVFADAYRKNYAQRYGIQYR